MTQQTTHLWEQVKEWLDGLDFAPSQSRLGEKVGVARSAVTAWKLGKAYPTPEHLAALARVMDSANAEAVYNRLLDATLRDQGYMPMPEEGGGAHAGGAAPKNRPGSGPVPTHPTALRLLKSADWDVSKALGLVESEPDSADTAVAADEIRALVPLTPAQLEAARRSAEHPPKGAKEQGPD